MGGGTVGATIGMLGRAFLLSVRRPRLLETRFGRCHCSHESSPSVVELIELNELAPETSV